MVNKNDNGVNKYLLISDFGETSFTSQENFCKKNFRVFESVKPEKGRKLCLEYDSSFNVYKDSLLDYPTIAAYKLNKNVKEEWIYYNRLVSVHVPRCPLDCWHCFVEECYRNNCEICSVNTICDKTRRVKLGLKEGWFSAKEIIADFLYQRELDLSNGKYTNILRVTGGEPYLVPELILEILEELQEVGLNNDVFVWTETNLIPFCKNSINDSIVSDEILKKISSFGNICIHPCFHGINDDNFKYITGEKFICDDLLMALRRLINAGIDVYPSIGSNVVPPNDVENFFNKVFEINNLLPLRFCLIEYDLNYEPVTKRIKSLSIKENEMFFDKNSVINTWDTLLQNKTSYKYGLNPRHLVSLGNACR